MYVTSRRVQRALTIFTGGHTACAGRSDAPPPMMTSSGRPESVTEGVAVSGVAVAGASLTTSQARTSLQCAGHAASAVVFASPLGTTGRQGTGALMSPCKRVLCQSTQLSRTPEIFTLISVVYSAREIGCHMLMRGQ